MIELTDDKRNKLLEIYQTYPRKESLKNVKIEINFIKIATEYHTILKPFLIFVVAKDGNFKETFKTFLEYEPFDKLPEYLNILTEDIEYGKYGLAELPIQKIITEKLSDINELQLMIISLVQKDIGIKEKPLSEPKFAKEFKPKPKLKKK